MCKESRQVCPGPWHTFLCKNCQVWDPIYMFKIFKQVLIFTKLGILSQLVRFILGCEIGKRSIVTFWYILVHFSGMLAWFGLPMGILAWLHLISSTWLNQSPLRCYLSIPKGSIISKYIACQYTAQWFCMLTASILETHCVLAILTTSSPQNQSNCEFVNSPEVTGINCCKLLFNLHVLYCSLY